MDERSESDKRLDERLRKHGLTRDEVPKLIEGKAQEVRQIQRWLVTEVAPNYLVNLPPGVSPLEAMQKFATLNGMLNFAEQTASTLTEVLFDKQGGGDAKGS